MNEEKQDIDGRCPDCGHSDYYRVFKNGSRWVKCDSCGFEAEVS